MFCKRSRYHISNLRPVIISHSFTCNFVTYMLLSETYGFPSNTRWVNLSFVSRLSSSQIHDAPLSDYFGFQKKIYWYEVGSLLTCYNCTAWVFFNCHFFFVRWVNSILRTEKKWQINKGFLSLFFYPDKKKWQLRTKKGENIFPFKSRLLHFFLLFSSKYGNKVQL